MNENLIARASVTIIATRAKVWNALVNLESVADSLFERSILLAIPSCLTDQDESEIIQAFEKTLRSCL